MYLCVQRLLCVTASVCVWQFWDVWADPSRGQELQRAITSAPDPHEAKWGCAREFGYKMATTFMPGYAKGT